MKMYIQNTSMANRFLSSYEGVMRIKIFFEFSLSRKLVLIAFDFSCQFLKCIYNTI